ncbi:3-methyl-2-oxobutanoate hydroxymethyltransferase [Sediminicurvatus halobius]|uniref:3-methyl-2-oxobutanoate hydroxymethyltransferase n=1 Tax=Sediminicurvatus halobius TaxID=2182432 RepID=A0A2U2MWZ3_9GAMM|nr:3-methyl-2-oxobutanoate hydroxymethyltransferase [Spiribacter halobius]PWG61377.1 3-methyl-2-oxobutanoate hydroxymethyltransferase [Spiribacter halobius]UEX76590.1 3-methyl-2-oxobutanoate hydroxymethyltransferase [Spiribacter halobius]
MLRSKRVTPHSLAARKREGQRFAAVTAYDYTSAQIVDTAEVPFILVGDTLGMVVQGENSTLPVTLEQVIYHAGLVSRGAQSALIIGDLPFMTYHASAEQALHSAGRLMQEGRIGGVKLEGGVEMADTINRLVQAGIPVCGHVGYTPQSANTLGGPRVHGRDVESATRLIRDAEALETAGAFAVVLELVPATVAAEVTRRLTIPTIGIGAGPDCDAEIQVFHDLFGLYTDFQPRHTRRYLNMAEDLVKAARQYAYDVGERSFPGPQQYSDLTPEARHRFYAQVGNPTSGPRSPS